MTHEYHQRFEFSDGSIAVRMEAGDRWTVLKGNSKSKAQEHAKVQNRFWKPWVKDALQRKARL